MARKNQRRRGKRSITPELQSDRFVELECVCLICMKPTGQKIPSRNSIIDHRDLKDTNKVREGLCPSCKELHNKGHTLFFSDTRGAILELEGNKKLKEHVRGGIWKIPEARMDELLKGNQ